MKKSSPRGQSQIRSFTKWEATIICGRLCIQPLSTSWRIAASTIGSLRPSS
jgi:hypothetical protein